MKLKMMSVLVDNQDKAIKFYTEKLGFLKKIDTPVSPDARWLTVVSPDEPEGTELLLEPNWNPAVPAKAYQKSLFDAGIPATVFYVDDIQKEYDRLLKAGVRFNTKPNNIGPVTVAAFDDTCGNLIQLCQVMAP